MNYPNTKNFWKENIKKKRDYHSFTDDEITPTRDWKEQIDKATTFKELDELGRKFRKHMYSQKWMLSSLKDFGGEPDEEKEYYNHFLQDLAEQEKELKSLENQDGVSKSMITDYENTVKNFENKIKAIVGNDLTNWETKITKTGTNDKDITDLRKKVTDLQTTKDNLDKELKDKQQQILNHRCDTPNNAELNQTKEELDKANKEIISLKEQLNNGPNNPLPNSPNDKEEKREEEQEISNLTLEELKAKLNEKVKEIRNLQEQLAKQNSSQSVQNSKKDYSQFLFGMAVSFSIAAVIGGMIYLIRFYKKKNSKFHAY